SSRRLVGGAYKRYHLRILEEDERINQHTKSQSYRFIISDDVIYMPKAYPYESANYGLIIYCKTE
ncbi:MAG: hypothetical protein K2G74_00635, partial [Muribaculaceae bacterium]|nr:hypothetical protein [Muribaculaceae bacterium]